MPVLHASVSSIKGAEKLGKVRTGAVTKPVFGCKISNSKKKFRHLLGDLNLEEIKNALRLLSVNAETNLIML